MVAPHSHMVVHAEAAPLLNGLLYAMISMLVILGIYLVYGVLVGHQPNEGSVLFFFPGAKY